MPHPRSDSWGNIKTISREEFSQFRTWIHGIAGIDLAEHKQALVMGRLQARVRHYQLGSYGEYFRLLTSGKHPTEQQIAIDHLTTNETYFFREPKHFDFLGKQLLPAHKGNRTMRVWSAAGSTGEEAYSIAMILSASLGDGRWEVLASDLSSRVLERARSGHYAMKLAKNIPREHLLAYCLKGIGEQDGTFVVSPAIRSHVQFMRINLNDTLPQIGEFEAIFIRNVMIYFDVETKRKVISRILKHLKPGGHLFIGHSESLYGVTDQLESVVASIYRKP
ncbi:MAG: SAM-dependent methyltransferase [Betaproteobacteria bacterium RBG_16_56_24]|nr:MAG: SAM-dependent methyltransferase [Betaproteobacteria bacterium RBG_16_56_24]